MKKIKRESLDARFKQAAEHMAKDRARKDGACSSTGMLIEKDLKYGERGGRNVPGDDDSPGDL